MPARDRFGPDDRRRLEDRRKSPIQQNEEQAVVARELDPATQLSLQHDQLVSQCRVLDLKPALRLEWGGQDRLNEADRATMVRYG